MLKTEYRIAYEVDRKERKQTEGMTFPIIIFYLVDTRKNFFKVLGR